MKLLLITLLFIISITSRLIACEVRLKIIGNSSFKTQLVEYKTLKGKKLVLIIPPTGGMNFIDESYAKNLCKNNINAVIVKNWTNDDEYKLELEIHARFYLRAQKAIDAAVNKYGHFQLAILGTSVGGLHASIALARLEQIKSGFFIVSGGNIASIIANTSQDILVEVKKKRFKKYNFKNNKEYQSAL